MRQTLLIHCYILMWEIDPCLNPPNPNYDTDNCCCCASIGAFLVSEAHLLWGCSRHLVDGVQNGDIFCSSGQRLIHRLDLNLLDINLHNTQADF